MTKRIRLKDLSPAMQAALRAADERERSSATAPRKRRKAPRGESPLVAAFLRQIADSGIPEPTKELAFAPPRRWRFDLAWPSLMVAAEIDGGVWSGGRHTRGAGFVADCEKLNAATCMGWRVLRIPGPHVKSKAGIDALKKLLAFCKSADDTLGSVRS